MLSRVSKKGTRRVHPFLKNNLKTFTSLYCFVCLSVQKITHLNNQLRNLEKEKVKEAESTHSTVASECPFPL